MILDNIKFGLKAKTILGLGGLLLFALLVMGGTIYYQAMTLAIDGLLETTARDIEKDVLEIENFVKNSRDDLMVISITPPIQGIIRARDNNGIDPLTGDKTEYWYSRMEQIFSAFLNYHPEYLQLSYRDEKGDEIVRADLIGQTVRITPRKELQNKAQYPCFTKTMKLRKNEIYYSEVSLNREQGVIQIPHTPVFRIATPVYDAQNKVRGVLVINLLTDALFARIRTTETELRKYVVNENGYFFVHPDRSWELGYELGNKYNLVEHTIKDPMPEFVEEMKAKDSQVKYHKQLRHVDAFKKIFYDPRDKNRYWAVIHEISEAEALKDIQIAGNTMLFVGLIIMAGSLGIITWFSTKKIVSPILIISEAVNKIEHGDYTVRVPEGSRTDELGKLGSSINSMAGIIEKNLNELTVINRVTLAASTSLSIPLIANNALESILELKLLKIQNRGGIFMADEKTRTLKLAASRGFSKEQETLDATVPFGDCLCGKVAETGEIIFSESCCENPQHTRKYAGITPHGHLVLPLKSGENLTGVLVLYLAPDTKIAREEVRLFQSIADVLAVSLQNALNFEHINTLKNQHVLILDSLGEGIYGLDMEGICTFMNPAAEQMLGYETGELNGKLIHPLTHHTRPDGSAYPREECRIYASFIKNIAHHVEDEVYWKKDGTSFPVEYTSTPIRDKNGAATGAVVVFSDVTRRKESEQVIKRNNQLLEAISQAQSRFISAGNPHDLFNELLDKLLSITGSEYGFIGEIHHDDDNTPYLKTHAITNIAWNEETRRIYGEYSQKGFEFRNLKSLYGTVITTGKMLISNCPSTDPRRGGVPKGHPPINALLCMPFFSGEEMVGMAGMANRPGGYDEALAEYLQPLIATCGNIIEAHRNEKRRKQAEDKISEYAETLELKVEERTRELEDTNLELQAVNRELELRKKEADQAKETAESANRSKSDFLANMSHELRTPLNSIIGFSEVMMDGLAGDMTADQKGYLKDISESGNHLLSLINDILDLSKVEAGKMELEPEEFNLRDLLEGSLVMVKEKALKHGIKLKVEIEEGLGNMVADERKIKQVLFNLLSNAMKFTPEGGSVSVSARLVNSLAPNPDNSITPPTSAPPLKIRGGRGSYDFIEISVTDTGIGISEEDQQRLFQPFQQLESSYTKKYSGTGLGLNLCKKFVELHGGSIWVESEPGKGSRFVFVIPVRQGQGSNSNGQG